MSLEQIAYLAQIIGVILVITSLVYVAQQLRQNTAAILAQSRQAMLDASACMASVSKRRDRRIPVGDRDG